MRERERCGREIRAGEGGEGRRVWIGKEDETFGRWGCCGDRGRGREGCFFSKTYDDFRVIDVGSAAGDGIDAVGEVDDLRVTFYQGSGFAVWSDVEDGAGRGGRRKECRGEGEGFHFDVVCVCFSVRTLG